MAWIFEEPSVSALVVCPVLERAGGMAVSVVPETPGMKVLEGRPSVVVEAEPRILVAWEGIGPVIWLMSEALGGRIVEIVPSEWEMMVVIGDEPAVSLESNEFEGKIVTP